MWRGRKIQPWTVNYTALPPPHTCTVNVQAPLTEGRPRFWWNETQAAAFPSGLAPVGAGGWCSRPWGHGCSLWAEVHAYAQQTSTPSREGYKPKETGQATRPGQAGWHKSQAQGAGMPGVNPPRSRICCQLWQGHRMWMKTWTPGSRRVSPEHTDSPTTREGKGHPGLTEETRGRQGPQIPTTLWCRAGASNPNADWGKPPTNDLSSPCPSLFVFFF